MTRDVVDRALRTPALIKEQSKGKGQRASRGGVVVDPFEDVVVGEELKLRLRGIASSTAGAKRWNAPFRHVLFHGPPVGWRQVELRLTLYGSKGDWVQHS